MSFAEAQGVTEGLEYGGYNEALAKGVEGAMGQGFANDVNQAIKDRYNQVSEVLDPQTDQPQQPK
jgi:hypothetical protein